MATKRGMLTRRDFLRGAVLVVGVLPIVAACAAPAAPGAPAAGGEPAAAPAAAPQEIRISAWGDTTDKTVYESIVDNFGKTHAGMRAIVEQYPGGYYDKIQANFAGGTSADVLYFQGWSWQPFADKDQLMSLDEFVARDSYASAWPDIPNYTDNTTWHGQRYMTVADTGSVVMLYNKDLFDKAEIAYPTKDWTYADFQYAVEKTSAEEGDVKYYGYAQAGGWNGTYLRSLHWMRMNGVLEWDTIVEPKESKWMQEEILAGLQYTVVDTIANGYCPSPATMQGGGVSLATGRVAMVMEGPWYLAQLFGPDAAVDGGVKFDAVEPPVGSTGKDETIAEVHGHVVAKSSTVADAAWELLKDIMSEEGQKRIAEGGRMCSTPEYIESLWVPVAQKRFNFENAKAYADSMRTGRNPIISGAGSNYDAVAGPSTPLQVAWDAMLNGTSAQDAIGEAQPLLQKILDDYWAKKG
ncbi:MAG: extracellular solute-binding protein [Chloroflexi bacterium]|nr:extracellular solute-binding protein [Chloroflexota bacterium]